MFSQNQVQTLMIGKDGVAVTASAVKPYGMAAGEIGAFTKGGTKIIGSSAAAGTPFVLMKLRTDGSILKSDVLSTANVKAVIRKVGSAAADKVEYYGYNGTSGSIEALDEVMYRINLLLREGYTHNDHGTSHYKHAIYKSDSSATEAEIAIGLAGSGSANFSREPKINGEAPIKFKAICNVAASATNDLTNSATFVKGSKTFTVATALTYNGASGTLAVGDFIRIAANASVTDLATDNATTRAYAVYEVKAINSLTVTVDRPMDHFTASVTTLADADDATQVIPAATGIAANWGVRIEGSSFPDLTANTVGKTGNKVVNWVSSIEYADVQSTTYTLGTAASIGTNTVNQIAELEWFLQGNEGLYMKKGYPFTDNPRFEVEDFTYETIDIVYEDTKSSLISTVPNRKVITIAVTDTTPGTFWEDNTDGLAVMLETLLAGVPVYGAADGTTNGGAMNAGCLD